MYNLQHDYAEGAHPQILQKLIETNLVQQVGYGEDDYSNQAREVLRKRMNNPTAAIYFVSGGTQANLLVISSLLRVHEGVISTNKGHIFNSEAGAIESIGHRVITVESENGKLIPSQVEQALKDYARRPHTLKPRMVYISNSTEIGTIYSKDELKALHSYCRTHDLLLFMDGARLGAALTAPTNDLTLADISTLTDVFYIGGTKNGALLGEAVVFNDPELHNEFDYVVKQKGAMLAKGRLLGIQFLTLFEGDLFFETAKYSNYLALKLANGIKESGFEFLLPVESNQLFPVFPNDLIHQLRKHFLFHDWAIINDNHTVVRIVTSWATEESAIDKFLEIVRNFNE